MSVIGVVAFEPKHSCAAPIVFEQSIQGWEADQQANWRDSHCTLLAKITWNTPESIDEIQPARHAESGVVVVADCRLDNRDELVGNLLESGLRAEGDCDLILRAWLRWGEDCVSHLLGDFAFALWDPRERLLFCATDPFGCRPLYYARVGAGVLAASDPAMILDHPAVDCSIDSEWLADSLAHISGVGIETPFAGLHRLSGGRCFTAREGSVSERQYWKPQPGSLAGLGTERAIIEEGRQLLAEAVTCRLRTAWPVGAELTGGIDSAGIVATAVPTLRSKGKDLAVFSRLRAASHTFLGPDEAAGVASVCDHLGIQKRFVSSCTGPGLLDLLARVLDRHVLPLCPWSIFCEEMRILAGGQGIRTMLSGFAGDNGFSASERDLPAQEHGWSGWQWRWKHQRALAQGHKNGHILRPYARAVLASFAPRSHSLLNSLRIALDTGEDQMKTILASSAFQALALEKAVRDRRRYAAMHGDRRIALLQNRQLQFRIASSALLATPHKQVWTYPLLDRRLIEFALACPPQMRTANGFSRRVARLVVEDRVPSHVAWKPCKGRDIIPGAREQVVDNGEAIRTRLHEWRRDPFLSSVFDLDRAIDASRPPTAETAAQWVLNACAVVDVLQIGDFLTRHADAGMKAVETLRAKVQVAG